MEIYGFSEACKQHHHTEVVLQMQKKTDAPALSPEAMAICWPFHPIIPYITIDGARSCTVMLCRMNISIPETVKRKHFIGLSENWQFSPTHGELLLERCRRSWPKTFNFHPRLSGGLHFFAHDIQLRLAVSTPLLWDKITEITGVQKFRAYKSLQSFTHLPFSRCRSLKYWFSWSWSQFWFFLTPGWPQGPPSAATGAPCTRPFVSRPWKKCHRCLFCFFFC